MNVQAVLLVTCGLLPAAPTLASIHEILIGLDEKFTRGAKGQE